MAKSSGAKPKSSRKNSWKQNPQAVQENILRVAQEIFAKNGLSGARVDEIAAMTETSKRMVYYYFGDKEGLYRRTLEEAYRKVRQKEVDLDLYHLDPRAALERLIRFTFRHHSENPDFIRLVMIENIHHGTYLAQSATIRDMNRGAVDQLERILKRGRDEGVFRQDADPLTIHWQISAMSFFNVSNRATFSLIFGDRLNSATGQRQLENWAVETVLRPVVVDPRPSDQG